MLIDPRYKDFKPTTATGQDKKNSKIPVLKGKLAGGRSSTKQHDPAPSATTKTPVLLPQSGPFRDINTTPPAIIVNHANTKNNDIVKPVDGPPNNKNRTNPENVPLTQKNASMFRDETKDEILFVPAAKKPEETDIEKEVVKETTSTTNALGTLKNVMIGEKVDDDNDRASNAMAVVQNNEKYEEILIKEKTTSENTTSSNKQPVVEAASPRSRGNVVDSGQEASGRNDDSNSKQESSHSKGVEIRAEARTSHSPRNEDKHQKDNSTHKKNQLTPNGPVEQMKDIVVDKVSKNAGNSVHRTSSFALVDAKLLDSIEPSIEPKHVIDSNETVVKLSKLHIQKENSIEEEENASSSKEKSDTRDANQENYDPALEKLSKSLSPNLSPKQNKKQENYDVALEKLSESPKSPKLSPKEAADDKEIVDHENTKKSDDYVSKKTELPSAVDDKGEHSGDQDPVIETIYNQAVHPSPGVHEMKKLKDSIPIDTQLF